MNRAIDANKAKFDVGKAAFMSGKVKEAIHGELHLEIRVLANENADFI